MKECSKCEVSAICFSLGKENLYKQVRNCEGCGRMFYKERPVTLPCVAYAAGLGKLFDVVFGRKHFFTCDDCIQASEGLHRPKTPKWLP